MTRRYKSIRQRNYEKILAERAALGKPAHNHSYMRLSELSTAQRKKLPGTTFAIPEKRAYPIPDEAHARNALARVEQHGTPEEKARVRAAVARKFPNIGKKK